MYSLLYLTVEEWIISACPNMSMTICVADVSCLDTFKSAQLV